MPLQLRDNLHWCNCGGRAVFLDIQADRYFCLPHRANDAFLRLASQETRPGDRDRLRMLFERGMLIDRSGGTPMRAPACIESPTRDFLEDPVQRPELLCVITALAAELRCGWALRTKSFHQLIEAIRKSRGSDNGNGRRSPRLEHIVSASATVSLITRSHDRCLVRALAMHSLCRRAGATLVFGVIAHPFTAHCWVQLGSAVLVGGYEQARLYTPILVVE